MSTYLNTIPKVETESGYIQFVPVNKFKSEKNINAMQVLQNPKTNKLFLSTCMSNMVEILCCFILTL